MPFNQMPTSLHLIDKTTNTKAYKLLELRILVEKLYHTEIYNCLLDIKKPSIKDTIPNQILRYPDIYFPDLD